MLFGIDSSIDELNSNLTSHVEQIYGNNYISLSENQDLNTVTNIGTYITQTDALARTIINRPSTVSVKFKLVVSDTIGNNYEGAKYKRQRLYMHNSAKIFDRRTIEDGTWSNWDEIS